MQRRRRDASGRVARRTAESPRAASRSIPMTDSSRPIRIKVIRKSTKASPDKTESLLWGDCLFCTDAAMTDYDMGTSIR